MLTVPLTTSSTVISVEKFWNTILIYHNRPHLVNRKLIAIQPLLFYEIKLETSLKLKDLLTKSAVLYEIRKINDTATISDEFLRNLIHCYDKNVELIQRDFEYFQNVYQGIYVTVRVLLPKNHKSNGILEVNILDKNDNIARFLAVHDSNDLTIAPPFGYDLKLSGGNLIIQLDSIEDADTNHAEWLADKLFPKLIKWSEQDVDDCNNNIQSLSLIDAADYCLTYQRLKGTYGEDLVKKWPDKTNTDPQKYVFEDIAIASYLICLWKKFKQVREEIKFVDCGCGNGLLVFLLNQEGYNGFGLDIRKRPTWSLYPKETELKEQLVQPTSTFSDCNWIIGNHSDELTPWIPIIASKSTQKTNFFVLPCCPYDLNGQKFVRINTSISQYSDYLNYIEKLCIKCGFNTFVDKLRIPSTKRTCFVGIQENCITTEIEDLISKSGVVKIREKFEKVRNCTQLNRDLIKRIVQVCVKNLLRDENYVAKPSGENWNKGGVILLSEFSELISRDDLKELKNECGGLQTLLRNHRYLFEMEKGGVVRLREPYKFDVVGEKYRSKPCWFFTNHPDGCLYDTDSCAYKHE